MLINYKPKSNLEDFGLKIYNLLVDNFPQTFFVGGMVRDFLLHKKVKDIDIATSAPPEKVVETLKKRFIDFNLGFQSMGVVMAVNKNLTATIATFRKDLKAKNRYPKIRFVKTPKQDAQRRDFTINSLYFSPKTGRILDFFGGVKDLSAKKIKFIGNAEKRIKEDPLRIIRAFRFALALNFNLDESTQAAINKHFSLVKQLTQSKTEKEIKKLSNPRHQKIILTLLDKPKLLDKYF